MLSFHDLGRIAIRVLAGLNLAMQGQGNFSHHGLGQGVPVGEVAGEGALAGVEVDAPDPVPEPKQSYDKVHRPSRAGR